MCHQLLLRSDSANYRHSACYKFCMLCYVKRISHNDDMSSDVCVLFRSYKMMDESSGQHLKDIENILEV